MMITRVLGMFLFLSLFTLVTFGQVTFSQVETMSTFANQGDYNELNNHLLFVSLGNSIEVSIKVKNIATGQETVILPNVYLSSPSFGWLDSSHVFYETKKSIGEKKIFSPWQGNFIRHNIFTGERDTLPSKWYSSENYVRNILSSDNKLFYTIYYKEGNKVSWEVYDVLTKETTLIKEQYGTVDFDIISYQFSPIKNQIFYVKKTGGGFSFVCLSLETGEEKVIKEEFTNNTVVSTAIDIDNLFYLEKVTPKNTNGRPDLKNAYFILKRLDLINHSISQIHSFDKGVEVSKIDMFGQNALLLSVQETLGDNTVNESVYLPSGGSVIVGLDATSYLYTLRLN